MPVLPALRRLVARRPWVQWLVIAALAGAVAVTVADAMAQLESERRAWGTPISVWVARHDVAVGGTIVAETVTVPTSMRPPAAVRAEVAVDGQRARRAVGQGEIVVAADLWAADDDLALAPDGWLVAPVDESPRSGAQPGDRVQVVSDGVVLADDGVVVGTVDDVTLVAVPADLAPLIPAASGSTGVSLLRVP